MVEGMSETGRGTIHLEIDSRLSDVALIGIAVRRLGAVVLGEDIATELEIGVVEAVNNAIEHAYQWQAGHPVRVAVYLDDDTVRLDVADRGRPMPPGFNLCAAALPPFDPGDLDSLPEGGMGLALIRSAADEVSYASRDGWNVLTLIRRKAAVARDWPELIEPAKLENLRLAIGDETFRQMVGFLPTEMERNLAIIRTALDQEDLALARHGAHKLRGQVGMFGALRIEAIGRAMEIDAGDLPAVRSLMDDLLAAVADTVAALRS